MAGYPSAPLIEDSVNCGVFTLRTPTTRGNILVVGNALDTLALQREFDPKCCVEFAGRAARITQLIRDDPELTWQTKYTGPKLVEYQAQCTGTKYYSMWATPIVCIVLALILFFGSLPNAVDGLMNGLVFSITAGVLGLSFLLGMQLRRCARRGMEEELDCRAPPSVVTQSLLT
jgi:hypothetical protein